MTTVSVASDTKKEDESGREGSRTMLTPGAAPPEVAAAPTSLPISSAPILSMGSASISSSLTSPGPASSSTMTSGSASTSPSTTTTDRTIAPRIYIHAFSGPASRLDGFSAALAKCGHRCIEFDTLNDAFEQNLGDEMVLQRLLDQLSTCAGVLIGPPCRTFSRARKHDGGPPPLRGTQGRDR